MEQKRLYEPGDMVATFTGEMGMVLSREGLEHVKDRYEEGRRPGRHFAPGCCHNPDYITQIPVLFENGTFDVMRAMNIRKSPDAPKETREKIQGLL